MSIRTSLDLLALASAYNAGAAWEAAMVQVMSTLVAAIGANPTKTIKAILMTPGVAEAMSAPFIQAGAETVAAIRDVWYTEAGDLVLPEADLNRAVKTAMKNAAAMPVTIRKALTGNPKGKVADRLQRLSKEMQRRAEMGVEFAQSRARTLAMFASAHHGAMKTWHAHKDDKTCSHCLALDGVTIPVHAAFDAGAGHVAGHAHLGTYGALVGPPRHPWCRCWVTVE